MAPLTLPDRLLGREVGQRLRSSRIKSIYGDSQFVDDLDIVNELGGHSGCVNALSWSRSGKLLASGSDDKVVNIWSYQPNFAASHFSLATSIDTGHRHNIFSCKFMPHSDDRVMVTCAGDSEVRVFDIEKAAHVTGVGSRLYLSPVSTNAKVFRSHSASVKRIVTEASPFYFLTCSVDGDVRQFDIRQPESAYPGKPNFRRLGPGSSTGDGPPPLISYRPYGIELYSLTCSSSQPHYIALGGTHLHCFLHDRRMLGRDKLTERGSQLSGLNGESSNSRLEEATKCVAKFAPHGQPTMRQNDNKQITACKLSDANPNDLIVSWTGEHIYSFNITKDQASQVPSVYKTTASAAQEDKKRKRAVSNNDSPSNGRSSRPRTSSADEDGSGQELSLLMQLGNGDSIEVSMSTGNLSVPVTRRRLSNAENIARAHGQRIRTLRNAVSRTHHSHSATDHEQEMLHILQSASAALVDIDDYLSHKTYPITSSNPVVDYELKLRADRNKVWRYVQASGTLARVLMKHRGPALERRTHGIDLSLFEMVRPAPRESASPLERHEQFGYDFIKAVLLWLDSGVGAVLREFSAADSEPSTRTNPRRFPVAKDASVDAIENELIPYLESLATGMPITYGGQQGGLGDDPRRVDSLFESEREMVRRLGQAMQVPFVDLGPDESWANNGFDSLEDTKDGITPYRDVAMKFWGHKVCISVLQKAAIDVNLAFTETAFGDSYSEDLGEETAELPATSSRTAAIPHHPQPGTAPPSGPQPLAARTYVQGRQDAEEDSSEAEALDSEDDDDGDDHGLDWDAEYDEEIDEEDEEEDGDDEEGLEFYPGHYLGSNSDDGSPQRFSKYQAGEGVNCSSHISEYRGHCNVNTTKDVNFYGLDDEYVVSGSDCGNLFIWDKKTKGLVNILEGDCEVVNVIQPHPYEPMLAVSGIDSTVKIFSPDARARRDAARGISATAADTSRFSSIGLRGRRHRASTHMSFPPNGEASRSNGSGSSPDNDDDGAASSDSEDETVTRSGLESRKRMHNAYQITSENDFERRAENQSTYISRGMLQLLAARLGQGGGNLEDVEENCRMM